MKKHKIFYTEISCCVGHVFRSYDEIEEMVFAGVERGVHGFCVPYGFLHRTKLLIPHGRVVSTPIDYPLGISSTKLKEHAIIEAARNGANAVDLVSNIQLLRNKQTKKFKRDIETCLAACKANHLTMRVMIDYKLLPMSFLANLAKGLYKMGVEYIFPTPGYHPDEFMDNLIVCKKFENACGIRAICNSNIYQRDQVELIRENEVFGMRFSTKNSLKFHMPV